MNLRVISTFAFATVTVFLFQNCQEASQANFSASNLSSGSSALASENTNSLQSAGTNNNQIYSASSNTSLKILAASTNGAQADCSRDDAALSQEIINAGADILVCAEFKLDMPTTSKRYGETFFCDSANKFKIPPATWVYNQANRSWVAPIEKLRNHSYIVPGSYRLVVKDNTGSIHRSDEVKVKKANSENCYASTSVASGSTGSTGTSCQWSGIVAGPEATPTKPCSISTVGNRATNDRGTWFTCVCR